MRRPHGLTHLPLPSPSLLVLAYLAACAAPATGIDDDPLLLPEGHVRATKLDYVAWGLDRAQWLAAEPRFAPFFTDDGGLRPEFRAGVVRIVASREVGTGPSPAMTRTEMGSGSGALFASDDRLWLITAKHVLWSPTAGADTIIATASGEVFQMSSTPADPWATTGRDLAALTRNDSPANTIPKGVPGSPPRVRAARRGEPVVIVGYPRGAMGIAEDGAVRMSPAQVPSPLALDPVFTFGEVAATGPMTIRFRGGFVPEEGMSGSPVLARDGALLGIYVAVTVTVEGDSSEFSGLCESVEDLSPLTGTGTGTAAGS